MEEQREAPGMEPGDAGEWCSVAEAARRIGVSEKAIRERIKHDSIRWRARGNAGREVFVTPEMKRDEPCREYPGVHPEVAFYRVEVARLEERLASRERDVKRLEDDLEHSREDIRRLQAELAEARKPVLLRLIEALRGKGR